MVRKPGPSREHMNIMPTAFKEGKLPTREINLTPNDAERFWRNVMKGDGCWTTKRAKVDDYTSFKCDNGSLRRSHRVAYTIAYGPIPEGLSICHKCDNKRCVRPDHLFAGTSHDNNADFMAKGLSVKKCITTAKITPDQVLAIREDGANLEHPQDIGIKYGLSQSQVIEILEGRSWAWVDRSYVPLVVKNLKWPRKYLTPELAVKIAEMFKSGVRVLDIAYQIGHREKTVRDVCYGKSWSHVTGLPLKS